MGASNSRDHPPSQLGGFDEVILNVAEAISEDIELKRLGYALGLKLTSILRALEANNQEGDRPTKIGTVTMLEKWAKTVKPPQRLGTLRRALNKAGLLAVEAKCCPSEGARPISTYRSQSVSSLQSTPGEDETMPDDIQALREMLKTRYLKKYAAINTAPESRTLLQQIYVSLVLTIVSSLSNDRMEESMGIEDLYKLIDTKTQEGYVTRLAFLGKVGVGRGTLFSKIALDWAMGKCLQDVNLLFLESFQEMEENKFFGNIVLKHFPDITDIEGERIDRYIKKNQRKVAILITNLDETKMDFTEPKLDNAVVSIVRGDRFLDTPILITTRPFVADLIRSIPDINELYTLIEVRGFTEDGMCDYIHKFFKNEEDSADSLIQFMKSNNVVLKFMAPFPIFCNMLCQIWDSVSRREALQKLGTLSHLMTEICFSLRELYCSKHGGKGIEYESLMEKAENAMKMVGDVAFQGLVKNQITINEESIKPYTEVARTAYEIGLLGREKRMAPREYRQARRRKYIEQFYFPHKLLQEYVASIYIAQSYEDNSSQFIKILEDTLLADPKKYRHVLFFVASHGGRVGKSVMGALCQKVDDISLILEVALECQDIAALEPVKKLLMHRRVLVPDLSSQHTFSAYIFALETYGKEVIEEVKHTDGTLDATQQYTDGPSQYARALCHMPRLQSLEMAKDNWKNETFFSAMALQARVSKVMTLKHTGGSLSPAASAKYAKTVVSMPKLQTLELKDVKLGDEFYPAMANGASKSGIMTLKHTNGSVGPTASSEYAKAVVSMPNLQNLELKNVELCDDFYTVIAKGASTSTVYRFI